MKRVQLRLSTLVALALYTCSLSRVIAQDQAPPWPLWDGQESVADYAKRTGLEPTKTLDLGNGIKLEFVLIPAGTFIMGTAEPKPVDEAGFRLRILAAQALLTAFAAALLAVLTFSVIRALRHKRWPQVSLARLVLLTVLAGVCVLSGLHWRELIEELAQAQENYEHTFMSYHTEVNFEKPGHQVTLTTPYYLGKFEVTQKQYTQVMGVNPSAFLGLDHPVEKVSWNEAQAFCRQVSKQCGQTVRLPTEAEWEYACRAGSTTRYFNGDNDQDLDRVAWSYKEDNFSTHPVGRKEANAFGLYDTHGNVWEWCADWFDAGYYATSPSVDPTGPEEGEEKMLRGGSWHLIPKSCSSVTRGIYPPDTQTDDFGFRVLYWPTDAEP